MKTPSRKYDSDMTREGEAAYRALKRNIGAEYLERAAQLCERCARDWYAESRPISEPEVARWLAQRIRELKESPND